MRMQLDDRWLGLSGFADGIGEALAAVSPDDAHRAWTRVIDPENLVAVAMVTSGQGLASQLLRQQITSAYPEGINRFMLRGEDLTYLSYTPRWNPQKMRIINAGELFR
jgi:hypothetical protein